MSELYFPEETSTGYIVTGIAEGLARKNDVAVLCTQPTYSQRGVRAPRRQRRNGVDIRRCWSTTLDKNQLLCRLLNLLTVSLSLAWQALRSFRHGDVVLVVTNPPLLPFAAAAACRARRARCILIVHDVYPDVLVAGGAIAADSVAARLLGAMSALLYRSVDRVVVLGEDMHALVLRRAGGGAGRVVVIPNWADLELVQPEPRETNQLLLELGLQDAFVLQYAGNLGRTHAIEELFQAALRLRGSKCHFVFVGSGAKVNWLEREIERRGADNVSILGARPRSDSPIFLNACDAAVIAFVPGMAGVSAPSRLYNILASGRPIVAMADRISELAGVVRRHGIGWIVDPGDVAGFVTAVEEAMSNSAERRRMGMRARELAEEEYSYERILSLYEELLCEMAE